MKKMFSINNKSALYMLLALPLGGVGGGLLASCTDFSDYNKAVEAQNPAAEKTLWENISAKSQLSDFAQMLKSVGYDQVLSAPTTYTVWAPVNGTFNKDSLVNLAATESGKKKVISEFVYDHVANYAHHESDAEDVTVYMLSKKLIKFTGKGTSNLAFDGKDILATDGIYNVPATNGILYALNGAVPFRHNAYEYIFADKQTTAYTDSIFQNYVKKYETILLDENTSVKGEIIDGVQHYDDSVTVKSNSFTRATLNSQLDNEDSLYTVVIPTDEAWTKAYDNIKVYYNYITPIAYQDLASTDVNFAGKKGGTCPTSSSGKATILDAKVGAAIAPATLSAAPSDAVISDTKAYWTDSISKRWIVRNTAFSQTNKHYNSKLSTGAAFAEKDTLYSTTRNKLTNLQHLDDVTVSKKDLSNGTALVVSDFPFYSFETYAKEITTRTPGRVVTASGYSYQRKSIDKSRLDPAICVLDEDEDELTYVKAALPEGSNFAPEMDFYLNDVLSTTYDFYAVIVPACIENDSVEQKPYTLRFDLHYTDAKNTPQTGRFNGETVVEKVADITKAKAFTNDPSKVDTLYLGRFTFPICYYGTTAAPNIKVMSTLASFNSTNRKKYDSEIRIANIILKPLDLVEFEKNAVKED